MLFSCQNLRKPSGLKAASPTRKFNFNSDRKMAQKHLHIQKKKEKCAPSHLEVSWFGKSKQNIVIFAEPITLGPPKKKTGTASVSDSARTVSTVKIQQMLDNVKDPLIGTFAVETLAVWSDSCVSNRANVFVIFCSQLACDKQVEQNAWMVCRVFQVYST